MFYKFGLSRARTKTLSRANLTYKRTLFLSKSIFRTYIFTQIILFFKQVLIRPTSYEKTKTEFNKYNSITHFYIFYKKIKILILTPIHERVCARVTAGGELAVDGHPFESGWDADADLYLLDLRSKLYIWSALLTEKEKEKEN